jgi:hypothetical protein
MWFNYRNPAMTNALGTLGENGIRMEHALSGDPIDWSARHCLQHISWSRIILLNNAESVETLALQCSFLQYQWRVPVAEKSDFGHQGKHNDAFY